MSRETTATPGNLLMKIESLSSFSKCGIDKFESRAFESGGYKWKMIFYPNGYFGDDNGNDNVSVYFSIVDRTLILCLLTGRKTLMDPSKGYALKLVEHTTPTKREWTIPSFSKLEDVWGKSSPLEITNGKLTFIQRDCQKAATCPSLFLEPKDFPPHRRVKAEVLMRIVSKLNGFNHWFTASGGEQGFPEFKKNADMDAGGFLHRDCCFVDVEITVQAVAKATI
ncbi:uncharacterized protein LOC121807905 [Salvia splendens]|uniref:uncharacterized protein LOC121807905 n=1 Tax=Salvia splendens TaxID=180675 RepID=UPI001C28073F|nr:uncharacterized protein LOC121807905 [Salvia splendens]